VHGHGVAEYFQEILGLSDNFAKSKIENGHQLVERHRIDKKSCLLIGDSTHDVETARALDIPCILVSRGFEDLGRLHAHGVKVSQDFSEIIQLFLTTP
jgi:phosphoglycolate phosphatase